ncbi:ammonium transporter [Devosia sp. 63-57]|uniref:ammonium transporter n=1 Tax=Devosia sp. 63-57 TaxID=1895751 RepID=UPI00086CDE09|nr:ammonium transporter [Devosia sp. 63-57]ODT47934.1 MAG: ammonia channel protein [Pelagibacterium sp. SCN 63-126]ODU87903.1 MAG: ammonia channel protein [Pelagibacterium sp. SCN 63-17]OJX42356.1 MAG: ammonia channel protein [Devosia sp. 63-57]
MSSKTSKILGSAALASLLLALPALGQDAVPAEAVEVATIDTGDTAWMIVSTILVILMTIPGLALFYGGLVRSKNILSVLTQVFAGFALIALLWVTYGYSLAFAGPTEGGLSAFIGDFSNFMLGATTPDSVSGSIPELVFVVFQLTFACITATLIVGGIAERMKFGAVMAFLAIWFTFSYLPIAHMVWSGAGLFFNMGALDFAGGTVVHINSGVAALVAAIVLGPRLGYMKEPIAPHNLVFVFIGASLLWVGWFGFNAGSALAANGVAAQAFLNTITAPAAAALAWALGEKITRGHASALGAFSGAVAGLVAITPAAGFAGTFGAIVLGAVASLVCLWAVVSLKPMLKYDDSLDVFGIHGIGGIVGAIGTAIVADPALGGFGAEGYAMGGQLVTQILAVVVAIVWSAVVTFVALLIVKALFGGLRVSEAGESDGLDLSSHGERAYN